MDISSDDEPFVEIVSSDDEDLDDFQPFALPDPVHDGEPVVDDVLAVGPQLNQFVIIGHPDGAHIVDYIPLDVVPLVAVPGDIVVSDDEDDIPVIHVDHPNDNIDDGEVLDIAILEVSSPVVSVTDISPQALAMTHLPLTSAELGYNADATDSSFDTIPIATQSPDHALAPILAHVDSLPVVPLDAQTPHTTPVTPIKGCPLTPPTADPHHVDLPTIFSHEIPAPRPGEGTSRQPSYFDTRAPVDFMSAPYFSLLESDPCHQSP
ncbi:hypothetical protein HanOQP8_Chr02g0051261 [Helianthus annuus]|nr:hypothetical protein HanOQP8_Chr02g0051261 [Helianthus annuus]